MWLNWIDSKCRLNSYCKVLFIKYWVLARIQCGFGAYVFTHKFWFVTGLHEYVYMYGGRFCHIRKESCSQVKVCINYIENTIITYDTFTDVPILRHYNYTASIFPRFVVTLVDFSLLMQGWGIYIFISESPYTNESCGKGKMVDWMPFC